MTPRPWTVAVAALCAVAVAACGLGPGDDEGDVSLTVTRDYGRRVMVEKTDSINQSDTVMRVLDRNAEITTRYGGGFVQSIEGLSGAVNGGRRSDWFFYVNGIESPVGSTGYDLSGGDRVWWDYRDWTAAMRVPAVVGSWPEPFVHGFKGQRWSTAVDCVAPARVCARVRGSLVGAGAHPTARSDLTRVAQSANTIDVLVGTWEAIRSDPAAALLASGPERSGVFARFIGAHKPLLELEDLRGQSIGSLGHGGGLVAALRPTDGPPVWVVTGTDRDAVVAAADAIGPQLRNRYAVATQPGTGPIGVPVP